MSEESRGAAMSEGLAVAEHLLRKVADYWDGRPLAGHGQHIYADLLDVLNAITPEGDVGADERERREWLRAGRWTPTPPAFPDDANFGGEAS